MSQDEETSKRPRGLGVNADRIAHWQKIGLIPASVPTQKIEALVLSVDVEPCGAGHLPRNNKQLDWLLEYRTCLRCGRPVTIKLAPGEGLRKAYVRRAAAVR